MTETKDFKTVAELCKQARAQFDANSKLKTREIDAVFALLIDVFGSIGKLYSKEDWENSQEEAAIGILMQAVETVLAMFFLAESGFWTSSLALKRNYTELLLAAMAIGYDKQCFIDWKYERSNIDSFEKIYKRVERSASVPQEDKTVLPLLKKYWAESSQGFSHNIKRSSIRTLLKDGEVRFEPKIATAEFQESRMNTIRNMLLNAVSVQLGITQFARRAFEARTHFPEGKAIIDRANACFLNQTWKSEPMN